MLDPDIPERHSQQPVASTVEDGVRGREEVGIGMSDEGDDKRENNEAGKPCHGTN